jgi:hypothetical protein
MTHLTDSTQAALQRIATSDQARVIPNRDHQHGGIEAVGMVAQNLKHTMRSGVNWTRLSRGEQEALDMVAHKIGRILSGANPHDPEHWEDVAGYAQTVMRATRVEDG